MKQIHSRHPLILAFGVALSAGLACSGTRGRANAPAPSGALPTAAGAPLSRAANAWVDRTLAGLTLRDQVAQMVMVWVLGDYASTTDADFANARRLVAEERIGGIVMSLGSPIEVAAKVNELQRSARIPLLISSDLEPGLGRLEGGTFAPTQYTGGSATILPNAMAIGATGDATLAEAAGRVTGAEARAVGIHLVFAPVVDVNNNPANPVINTRSFGEDAAEVSRLSVAFVRGMQSAGIAATAKHFPGHGDTETDSHLALPVVRSDRARLDAVELAPFRATINAGIAGVMSAHVALPAIARDSIPATLAPAIMTGLLRDTLGFRGLTLTDALTMQGIGQGYDVEQSAVLSVKAGSDIMLMPSDVPRAIGAVVRAVEQGVIPRAAISAAVRRQLVLKVQTGAVARPVVPLDSLRMIVGSAEHRGIAAEIGKRAVTLLRDRDALIPLRPGQLTLAITYGVESDLLAGREFTTALRAGIGAIRTARVSPSTQRSQLDSLLRPNERLVVYTMVRTYEGEGRSALAPA
ncbi:MAG: hypothetical protein FJ202_09660, partial [Gemmatimonadetes bacterium]|nr:hypothetical protein [Gemmatimonadota bacterium]